MELIIILSIILVSLITIRHYQVKTKHAGHYWEFERGKQEEYKRAYYAKSDELEQIQHLYEMAKFDKKQAFKKAAESNKHVLELQENNLMITLERNNLQLELDSANKGNADLLEVANAQLQELGAKYTQQAKALSTANENIKEVHKLLNSGARGQETMAALVLTGEYMKVQKNN